MQVCWICLTLDIFLMQRGKTPMYIASQQGHPRLVELLLAHGADINKVQYCNVCMQWNSTTHANMWIASSFLEVMWHSTVLSLQGSQSPLYVASLIGNVGIVQLLVHHHAAINQPTVSLALSLVSVYFLCIVHWIPSMLSVIHIFTIVMITTGWHCCYSTNYCVC